MFVNGTFAKCQPARRVSAYRGRPDCAGDRQGVEVQVYHHEGVANRIDPESCPGNRVLAKR